MNFDAISIILASKISLFFNLGAGWKEVESELPTVERDALDVENLAGFLLTRSTAVRALESLVLWRRIWNIDRYLCLQCLLEGPTTENLGRCRRFYSLALDEDFVEPAQ